MTVIAILVVTVGPHNVGREYTGFHVLGTFHKLNGFYTVQITSIISMETFDPKNLGNISTSPSNNGHWLHYPRACFRRANNRKCTM